ncbi:Delta(14)-sterol reductase [Xylona heveae TC161]|uniref:Delta(14)-sterol reductase n=1 Tax=Xylona heveae (strain CBS 132557 / TC161) TaxID=1328760 RepID=A0A165HHI5_XYLHT|nr:Delta(14)-sterol reductase [Xylona heveae TC161]KZF23528.1 Delta(14)-sterol reductase [Xylona heveae TC161]
MPSPKSKSTATPAASASSHGYEFGGPLGAFGITFGLPILCYAMSFLCNDVSGCPVPSLLHPSTLTWAKLKDEIGWPRGGVFALASAKGTLAVLGYYFALIVLQAVLPGQVAEGVQLSSGGRLKYRLNAFTSVMAIIAVAAVGTLKQGSNFVLWTFIWDNYRALLTANIAISYALAWFVYIRSFSIKRGNPEHRELANGGKTGNLLYDWFIGRELNPRVTIPVLGTVDIKEFCELRPGLLGWILLDLAFIAQQYRRYGFATDSIFLITGFQALYVFDALWMEPAVLTTMDITTDGFGFMLAFGDLVWVPFIYSLQCRYLAVHPVQLGLWGTLGVLAVQGLGYSIFRGANNEKNRFRTDPKDPKVAHLKYMETKSGSKLLISGWWGVARHINYFGDWVMAWAWCLPTGIAGYMIQKTSGDPLSAGSSAAEGSIIGGQPIGAQVVQGEARGWGMIVTYFYVAYFGVLLVHREMRDEQKCRRKYGNDWDEYRKKVPWRMIPGVY